MAGHVPSEVWNVSAPDHAALVPGIEVAAGHHQTGTVLPRHRLERLDGKVDTLDLGGAAHDEEPDRSPTPE